MKTFTQKLYIHKAPSYYEGDYIAHASDMSNHGSVFLGEQEVELNIPDTDPIEAEIQMLANEADRLETEAYAKVQNIKDRIKQLSCLEYKPEAGE